MKLQSSLLQKSANFLSSRNWEPLHWVGIFFSVIARILPHPVNFSPVGALSVYSGARIKGWTAYAVPVILMLISDRLLGWIHGYDWLHDTLPVIYLSFLMNVSFGRIFLSESSSIYRTVGVTMLAAVQFFLVTNFAVWAIGSMYPKSWEGLFACYLAALPFFQATILGDLVYSAILFGVLDGIEIRVGRNLTRKVSWAKN
ncbi:hypothetical protein CH371_01255 [Leptospira wolffii]|uniref:Uncharacterized protein n=1 Tax=Leptospira wolffii TaxID=409998 RepID=A0A2M9ZE93_9LEPT|nr:DUF6580 family putative transport protein [Leptospira wolffii]PJZ66761.1 hypothetical protein CH371_01255 [Leptospira wolffii]